MFPVLLLMSAGLHCSLRTKTSQVTMVEREREARPIVHSFRSGIGRTLRYQLPLLFVADYAIAPAALALPTEHALQLLEIFAAACEPLAPIGLVIPIIVGFFHLAAFFGMLQIVRLLPIARSVLPPTIDTSSENFQALLHRLSIHWVGPISEEIVDRTFLQGVIFQRCIVERFGRDDPRLRTQLWRISRVLCSLHFGCSHAATYTSLVRNAVPNIPAASNVLSQCGLTTIAAYFVYVPAYRQDGFASSLAAHVLWNAIANLYARPLVRLGTLLLAPPMLLTFLTEARLDRLESRSSDADTVLRWAGQR